MNDLFVKLLESLREEKMVFANFTDKGGATICLQKDEKFFEVKLKESKI